jgi:hypothetical protein
MEEMMMTARMTSSGQVADARAVAERAIGVIDELIAVIGEENGILARGMPSSLAGPAARKSRLADELARLSDAALAQGLGLPVRDDALRRRLDDRRHALRASMAENSERLRAAMEASRRRIEAVMRAVRADAAASSPYGANGRVRGPGATSVGTTIRV